MMNNTIVIFYSRNNSNRYLAEYIAKELTCDIEEIVPRIKAQALLMMGLGGGIRNIEHDLSSYERVILIGPVWMGKLVYPLKTFVLKYINEIDNLVFITCCGSSYEMKDKKFGHELVFKRLRMMLYGKNISCHAFPITLVLSDDEVEDTSKVMETRLNDTNFTGDIKNKVDKLLNELKI